MEFTSLAYAIFLPVVFILYRIALRDNYKAQNVLILLASYIFYGWWDWRFAGLLFLTTFTSYISALAPQRFLKPAVTANVVLNVAILCVFKYFNFFSENLRSLFGFFGIGLDWLTLEILLPVGISFYTFQAISYSVDVYRGKILPTRDFVAFAGFVSFFPQLVAGPIERSWQLLPQFLKPRPGFDYGQAVEGMRRILWGLFKKCVVADGVAYWVDLSFGQYLNYASTTHEYIMMVGGIIGFTLQLYGDFSGYSDIARGSAQLLGFKLNDNFLFPYFSRNALEFWHRWHRSLMQWFTEYVYIPLGGSRRGNRYVNVSIVFLLSGLWHGADWSFVVWGVLCGIWYVVSALCGAEKYRPDRSLPATSADLPKMMTTVMCWSFTMVFFRADDISAALIYISKSGHLFVAFTFIAIVGSYVVAAVWRRLPLPVRRAVLPGGCLLVIAAACVSPTTVIPPVLGFMGYVAGAIMLVVEWRSRNYDFGLARMPRNKWVRYSVYMLLYILIFTNVIESQGQFIYFQF